MFNTSSNIYSIFFSFVFLSSSLCFVFTLPIELVLLGHSLQLLRTGEENWSILENVPEMTLAIINKKKDVQTKMTLAIIY